MSWGEEAWPQEAVMMVNDLEDYREELIRAGQADDLKQEYVKVIADRLGTILRRFYD